MNFQNSGEFTFFSFVIARTKYYKKRILDKMTSYLEFDNDNDKDSQYEIKEICNSAVYAKELERSHLSGLYYCVSLKDSLKKENTWELTSVFKYFWKLINNFYKDYPNKLAGILLLINTVIPITKPIVRLFLTKQKRGWPAKTAKRAKKSSEFNFLSYF